MLHDFFFSFRLRNTYRVNAIIYSLKQLPLLGKHLPVSLYRSKALKILGNIISAIMEIIGIFIGKFLYIALMIVAIMEMYETSSGNTFLHIFTFLTLAGALMNTYLFNPTKDKYYALELMKMDAKNYTLANYYYALCKVFIGFLPFTILYGWTVGLPLWLCCLLPIFVIFVKAIAAQGYLRDFKKTKIARNENLPTKIVWVEMIFFVLLAYGLPLLNIELNIAFFLFFFSISAFAGIYSLISIAHFQEYRKVYHQLLTKDMNYIDPTANATNTVRESVMKQIAYDDKITSNKHGYGYFHELFVKRHRKILTTAVKKQSIIIILIFTVLLIAMSLQGELKDTIHRILMTYLPYFVFIMYLLNRGSTLTQAMFMNCDHAMLTYRIYRTPKVILGIFRERLKTLISINLIPAFLIATGLVLLFGFSGGGPIENYLILFTSILAMSIFFSVHYLVMYYLLQPYNINTEIKSSTYKLVQGLTYFVCYYMIQIKLPTFYFGLATILFSVFYSLVSLILVYCCAPKTFRIRL